MGRIVEYMHPGWGREIMNTKGKYEKKGAERMVFQYTSLVGNQ
jgi:hypothetical protein